MFRHSASLDNFVDEPEETLGFRPPCSTQMNREPGDLLRDLSREMQPRDVLVVSDGKLFVRVS